MIVLAHVSDLHLDGSERATGRARQVMDFLAPMTGLDAILVTGDIADHGLPEEYAEARALLDVDHRVLMCPGNHDRRAAYREVLLGEAPTDEPVNAVHDLPGGLRVAMCDSSIPGRADGFLADETLAWLDGVLSATPPGVRCLVAFHHPPVVLHSPFIDAIRQHGAERLAAVLRAHPQVVAVLCGHAHTPAASTFAGRPLLVGPGVASTLRLPWESRGDIDRAMPPAIAFHVLDDEPPGGDGALTSHFRLIT